MRKVPHAGKSAPKLIVRNASTKSGKKTAPTKSISPRQKFAKSFSAAMKAHGEDHLSLFKAVQQEGVAHSRDILVRWASGRNVPRVPASFELLRRIEIRYDLPEGYFRKILKPESPRGDAIKSVTRSEQHLVKWHLPANFDDLPSAERARIFEWIQQNVLACSTEFGRYMKRTCEKRYRLRFRKLGDMQIKGAWIDRYTVNAGHLKGRPGGSLPDPEAEAPPQLVQELEDLVTFKRSTFALPGYQRYAGWSESTAEYRANSYGRLFGALVASPRSSIAGLGVRKSHITLGLMAFPKFWDWYLAWSERRRGFYTKYELNTLLDVLSLLRNKTGWIRQHPELAQRLLPIPGLISRFDIRKARRSWDEICDAGIDHMSVRVREVRRIMQTHRDPFLPILPILNSDSPLAEYKKIADEILRLMPDEKEQPVEAAEAIRTYLMLRLAMHLGFRQRNLRELLLCLPGQKRRGELALRELRCGELRWSELDAAWEVFAPALAFKNWDSTFFNRQAFRLLLPDVDKLYYWIDKYICRHRGELVEGRKDPGTFFVRKLRSVSASASMDEAAFTFAWRNATQKYGIYNPFTKRGAIAGLLPHGPHAVRDVLATHLIKQTGSYDLAAFAIQDTTRTVKLFYARFLPEEKVKLAAKVLNDVWSEN
jgi:hypothetical protein